MIEVYLKDTKLEILNTADLPSGKKFKSRFIQPGLAGYPQQYGNVLITKETLDKFVNTLEGKPVIINHQEVTTKNVADIEVGRVHNVWFDEKDGWYWCDGVLTSQNAIDLVKQGYSVSCSYNVSSFTDEGGTVNNIGYDMQFLDGVFTHLAIVKNPRYEDAEITVVNSNEDNFKTVGEGDEEHVVNFGFEQEVNTLLKKIHVSHSKLRHPKKYIVEFDIDGIEKDRKKHNLEKMFGWDNVRIDDYTVTINTKPFFDRQNAKRKDKNKGVDNMADDKGRWITIKGNHIFLRDGETPEEGLKRFLKDKEDRDRAFEEYKSKGEEKKESIADLKSQEEKILKKYYEAKEGSSKREQLQRELDAVKEKRFKLEDESKKKSDSLEGKYEDGDFDEEEAIKDIATVKKQGKKSVEEIAEYLGLDEDEVRVLEEKGQKKEDKSSEGEEDKTRAQKVLESDEDSLYKVLYHSMTGNKSAKDLMDKIEEELREDKSEESEKARERLYKIATMVQIDLQGRKNPRLNNSLTNTIASALAEVVAENCIKE